ncbi:unnamed protein product [Meloidogyne enterolobii]|uniref:Uncharacterized protein n=2 Tax=Meloidogyne enterolobii TaxID=390850 RepID=A0A6V7XXW2_MELEN|nr:unnamed protein product [Meloidogyne enterolobii]
MIYRSRVGVFGPGRSSYFCRASSLSGQTDRVFFGQLDSCSEQLDSQRWKELPFSEQPSPFSEQLFLFSDRHLP